MIRLSLDEINLRAPYEVAFARQSGTFRFTTRQGRQYTVGFVEETMLPYSGIYQFFIRAENHTQNDDDMFATVVSILEVYFDAGALALTYSVISEIIGKQPEVDCLTGGLPDIRLIIYTHS